MKKILKYCFRTLLSIILIMALFSCESPENNDLTVSNIKSVSYDDAAKNLAFAVSRAISSSDDFRTIVKHEAMKQLDGDYDILLMSIVDKKLSDYNNVLKKSASDISVGDIIDEHLVIGGKLKSTDSNIKQILRDYPELQIAVPVNCDTWVPESHTPLVAYINSEFRSGTQEKVNAYAPDGSIVKLDAVKPPDEAVIVVGLNERLMEPRIIIEQGVPGIPSNLVASTTESGIHLNWEMPSTTTSVNTSGYNVYRKASQDYYFSSIGTISGCYNRAYDDNSVEPGKSYTYYVNAYYGSLTSVPSNYISSTAPLKPKPVLSFDVIQHSNTRAEMRWENDHSQSFTSTRIYRYRNNTDDDYILWKVSGPDVSNCFDNSMVKGETFHYKINHVSPLGISNSKYDFVRTPYRDISKSSPVYLHVIDFKDWRVESWLDGKPEFYVTLGNVNISTGKTYNIQEKLDFRFFDRFTFSLFPDTKLMDWSPGVWHDMITFSVVEYDAALTKLDIKYSAGFTSKDPEKKSLLPTSLGAEVTYSVKKGSLNCGTAYMNYYDFPEGYINLPLYGVRLLISDRSFGEVMTTGIQTPNSN